MQGPDVGDTFGWPGDRVEALDGPVRLQLWVTVDASEHERRASFGAISSLRTVAALASLPHQQPVAAASLDTRLRGRLRRLPQTLVDRSGIAVVRQARVPARIHGVAARGPTWERTAEALGAYVTVAQRVAAVERIDDQVRGEALVWGIGLLDAANSVISEPRPPTIEVGPYQWWLAEQAYSYWLERRDRAHART